MSNVKLGLVRKEFNLHAGKSFGLLFEDNNFTDVTLVSADNQQLPAHKVILSTGSHFFREIFLRNPHPHPLLYLKLRYSDLLSLMRFIYLGECDVDQRDIDLFLQTAKELRVEGLSSEDVVKEEEQLVSEREDDCFESNREEKVLDNKTNLMDNTTELDILEDNFLEDSMALSGIEKESVAENKLDIEKKTTLKNTKERKIYEGRQYVLDKKSQINKLEHKLFEDENTSLHKTRVLKLLQENKNQKGRNQKGFKTQKDYAKTLQRMIDINSGKVKPASEDSNTRKRYEVKEFEIDGILSTRLVKKGTNKKVLSDEEIFEVLYNLHISSGHSGHRDTLRASVRSSFANISNDPIVIFLKCCKYCQAKRRVLSLAECSAPAQNLRRT